MQKKNKCNRLETHNSIFGFDEHQRAKISGLETTLLACMWMPDAEEYYVRLTSDWCTWVSKVGIRGSFFSLKKVLTSDIVGFFSWTILSPVAMSFASSWNGIRETCSQT